MLGGDLAEPSPLGVPICGPPSTGYAGGVGALVLFTRVWRAPELIVAERSHCRAWSAAICTRYLDARSCPRRWAWHTVVGREGWGFLPRGFWPWRSRRLLF